MTSSNRYPHHHSDLSELKRQIDLRDVVEHTWGPGQRVGNAIQYFSPWRDDGHKGSLTVYHEPGSQRQRNGVDGLEPASRGVSTRRGTMSCTDPGKVETKTFVCQAARKILLSFPETDVTVRCG